MTAAIRLVLHSSPLNTVTGTGQVQDLTAAFGTQITRDLVDPDVLSFSIPAEHWQAGLLLDAPFKMDVVAYVQGSAAPMQRFRMLPPSGGGVGRNGSVINHQAVAYKGLLGTRIFFDTDQRSWGLGVPALAGPDVQDDRGSYPWGDYEFGVTATSAGGETSISNVVAVSFDAPESSPPANSGKRLGFRWSPVVGATGYKLYRRAPGGSWALLRTQAGTTWADIGTTSTTAGTPPSTNNVSPVLQNDLAWSFVSVTQSKTDGALGVVRGNQPSANPSRMRPATYAVDSGGGTDALPTFSRTEYYQAGKTRQEALDELSQVIGGFEYDIVPDPANLARLYFHMWTERGRDFPVNTSQTDPALYTPVSLVVGDNVSSWGRNGDASEFANVTRTEGRDNPEDNGGTGVVSYRPSSKNPARDTSFGRWERNYSSEAVSQAGVDEHADGNLANSAFVPSYSVTLRAGAWTGPGYLDIGDETKLVNKVKVFDPRTNVESYSVNDELLVRVVGMNLTTDDNGLLTVQLTLGKVEPDIVREIVRIKKQLRQVEFKKGR